MFRFSAIFYVKVVRFHYSSLDCDHVNLSALFFIQWSPKRYISFLLVYVDRLQAIRTPEPLYCVTNAHLIAEVPPPIPRLPQSDGLP